MAGHNGASLRLLLRARAPGKRRPRLPPIGGLRRGSAPASRGKGPGAEAPGGKVVSHAKGGAWRVYNSALAYRSWAAGQSWTGPQQDFQAEVAGLLESGQAGCATFVDFGGKWWVGCFRDDGSNWYEEFKARE